ncbi:SDR family oxidoreductase [Synechococcus sp. PCC 7336]|uniref:SDR family oxidoreductase n=1 Tax=Synechococcus sp. PCC 7336 TaxID=195250 RepID=UPI0003490EB0|nr:SDR family oxidoreductase [Synechococcus sp. PCC 7336]
MSRLQNSIVMVTGASSGIGSSCARAFAEEGAQLILAARSMPQLQALASQLKAAWDCETRLLQLDVRDRPAVETSLAALPDEWKAIDVLVNNAGLSRGLDKLQEAEFRDWEEMIDTNIKGLLYVTRVLLPGMVERDKGHVINIGSTAGHEAYAGGSVYCATKFAVKALTQALKKDLHGTAIRVSSVDPGLVETNFSNVRFRGDLDRASNVYAGMTPLTPDDVAEIVLFCASRPAHVNISDVIVMPTDQSAATMVHRRKGSE